MKLFAYVRISSKQQLEDKTHLTQEREIKNWSKLNNHEIIRWYRDLAISGKELKNRPKFNQMMEDIKLEADGIVSVDLSRTSRSLKDLLWYIEVITETLKKHAFYVREAIDTSTPTGKLIIQIIGAVNEFQRTVIQEAMEEGRQRALEEGRPLGGPKKFEISKDTVIRKLRRGKSPEDIGRSFDPPISGKTIRRRMKNWGIYNDYLNRKYGS